MFLLQEQALLAVSRVENAEAASLIYSSCKYCQG